MNSESINSSLVFNVRPLLSSAEEEVGTLLALNRKYQSNLFSLNSIRRKLLFSANDPEVLSRVILLINDLELMRDNIENSRCHLSAILSSAMTYLVNVAESEQDMQSLTMRRLRNDLRTITKMVQDTKVVNVDYSALVSLATYGSVVMSYKEKSLNSEMTRRLFVALKNSLI